MNSLLSLIINEKQNKLKPHQRYGFSNIRQSSGFTIVELLVVIAVVGILATIIMVSYSGITSKAVEVSLKTDLSNAYSTLLNYNIDHGKFPTVLDANDCPSAPTADSSYCLKASPNNEYTDYVSDGTTIALTATNANGIVYHITDSGIPEIGAYIDPNWVTIGTQTWSQYNLNVGTMIAGISEQTNNSIVEKYCYNNLEANCTTYGGLYQWNEAMAYSTTESAQGICPAGSHIPSDAEWKTLEMFLGMTQPQADAIYWRGTNQGTQLQPGGGSGMNVPLAGYRTTDGSFSFLSSDAYLWSSSESGGVAWRRYLTSGYATVYRSSYVKASGFSVRCIGN